MAKALLVEKVVIDSIDGNRADGKIRIRWIDCKRKGSSGLIGIRNWREQSRVRNGWKRKFKGSHCSTIGDRDILLFCSFGLP